jgi:hypothetical protein
MNFGERPTLYRKTLGVVAIVVAMVAATALWVQIVDLVRQGAFVWDQYFSYFTILVTVVSIVALLFGGFSSMQTERDGVAHTAIRQSLVTYALITAVVYHFLLRDLTINPDVYVSADSVPMQLFHTYLPLYLLIDWLINPHRQKAPSTSLLWVTLLPALWLGVTLFRGSETGWYPYGFLNPSAEAGWSGVAEHTAVIAVAIVVVQLVLMGTNRLTHRKRPEKVLVGQP